MAKFFELSDENKNVFETIWEESGLVHYVDLILLGVPKAKELIKVAKTNPYAEYLGKCPDSVVCVVYEQAFDRLDERGKKLLAEDALNTVFYDGEKDKVLIGVPQVTVTVGGRQKYGDELLNYSESAVLAIQQIAEEEAERKAAEKEMKKSKKNG